VTDRDDAPRNDPGWTSPEGSEYEQEKRGAGAAEQGPPNAESRQLVQSIAAEDFTDLPALHRAFRLQDRAAGVGFDWPDVEGPIQKVEEELNEVRGELGGDPERLEAELGDLLFAVVNLSRKLGVDPERELRATMHRFKGKSKGKS